MKSTNGLSEGMDEQPARVSNSPAPDETDWRELLSRAAAVPCAALVFAGTRRQSAIVAALGRSFAPSTVIASLRHLVDQGLLSATHATGTSRGIEYSISTKGRDCLTIS